MYRWEIINREIKLHNYKTYLEVGVENGFNFKKINSVEKIATDPDPKSAATHIMSSDDFFERNKAQYKKKFDIIFIDGLHHADQVYKDICNSVDVLNEGGTIVLHDMLPENEGMQQVPRVQKVWTGDCWKAFVKWRKENWGSHRSFTIDCDFGVGIIKLAPTAAKNKIPDVELNWQSFSAHKKDLMSVISFQEYVRRAK